MQVLSMNERTDRTFYWWTNERINVRSMNDDRTILTNINGLFSMVDWIESIITIDLILWIAWPRPLIDLRPSIDHAYPSIPASDCDAGIQSCFFFFFYLFPKLVMHADQCLAAITLLACAYIHLQVSGCPELAQLNQWCRTPPPWCFFFFFFFNYENKN